MDFALTADQERFAASAREVAALIAPDYAARERDGRIDPELAAEIGARGLIAPELPTELGGQDAGHLTSGLVTEEIARGDFNVAYLQIIGSLAGHILSRHAHDAAARRWVPAITAGTARVGIGLSEPTAGSDAGNPALCAHRERGGWVLTGTKSMSFALDAAAAVVFARTDPDAGRGRGITAFLLDLAELEEAGTARRERIDDLGTRAVGRGLVHLENAWVPEDAVVGAEGQGFIQVMQGFDFSRALIGLQCLAPASASVAETWQYTRGRLAFDKPLSSFEGVAFPIAEAETTIEAARLLCLRTLWLKDQGQPHTAEAAMCKWLAPKTAYEAINDCLLLHGQLGYTRTLPFEQRLRDVLGLQIGDGTAQIMKMIIARHRVGREFAP